MTYHLTVRQVEQTCLFELTWGRGRRLNADLPYPPQLEALYHHWQQAYLNFYRQELRGRVGVAGQVTSPAVDRHSRVVEAEARLLSEFHRWLRDGKLLEIRQVLGQADLGDSQGDILLSCNPLFLARLPWETWELKVAGGHCRIARVSHTIQQEVSQSLRSRRGKPRVLLVLGDDTGLSLAGDRQAFDALKAFVHIEAVGWQPGKDTRSLKQEICSKIAAAQGWDILFFAGHSNESAVVDGNLAIAPNTALSIRELAPYLQKAQAHGLKFALFNSCRGLTIAEALVKMGLSQVAIMREPIHNQVAQRFLVPFLQALVEGQDVQDALVSASRHLKSEQSLTYPSAYLVPSLFRHPDAVPYRLPRNGWRQQLQRWLPSRRQGLALAAVAVLSVVPTVRETLLSGRLLTQAVYRNLTGQFPKASPPVVLVQVDEASRRESEALIDPTPISQRYLANLLEELTTKGATVVGIDYLLDLPQPEESPLLASAVRKSVAEAQAWLVFAAILEGQTEVGVNANSQIIEPVWAMEAYTNFPSGYLALPWPEQPMCSQTCPFSYVLALASHYDVAHPDGIRPALTNTEPLRRQLLMAVTNTNNPSLRALKAQRISPITALSGHFKQRWLRPLLDFSLPPDRVFHRIPAYQLLDGLDANDAGAIANAAVVLIGGVEYSGEGIGIHQDIAPNPPAVQYWRDQDRDRSDSRTFAGVEAIAYSVHHFLTAYRLIPVPALWMVGVSAIVGAAVARPLEQSSSPWGLFWLSGGTVGYGLMSLQGAIWTPVLLPWLLPSATVWIYVLPQLWRPTRP
jgi:hypothetical protein